MKRIIIPLAIFATAILQPITSFASESKMVYADGVEPQRPLIPGDTTEVGGGFIVDSINSGLKHYDENGVAINDLAASIESTDKQHYVVKIRDDAKFSDGSSIKAKHFVDAWNLVVKNQQPSLSFFSEIQGYPNEGEDFKELSGLKVVDDKTFTIDLKYPIADFENRLGYTAFYPMPDQAFSDLKAYGQFPSVSSGPYKIPSADAWRHNIGITLVVNKHYNGPRKAKNDGIKFKFYAKATAAYADLLSDRLDVLYTMPDEGYLTAEADLDGRYILKPQASIQHLGLNVNKEHFKMDDEGRLRRKAISMAINREEITTLILSKARTPAVDFTSPSIAGFNPNLKGSEVLQFNPEEAKKLWAEADKISKFDGTLYIAYNADGSHQNWVDAVSNQLKNNLGVNAVGDPYPDFKSALDDMLNRKVKLLYRTGWMADYPAADNFLTPLFSVAAIKGSNYSDYNNPVFEKYLTQATSALNQEENIKNIVLAQEVLLQDLPVIPLWYYNTTTGYGKNVDNVKVNWRGMPIYEDIIKK